ncbi:MAG: hypothetical protein QHC65_17750, partial [Sphingomonas sp.]
MANSGNGGSGVPFQAYASGDDECVEPALILVRPIDNIGQGGGERRLPHSFRTAMPRITAARVIVTSPGRNFVT